MLRYVMSCYGMLHYVMLRMYVSMFVFVCIWCVSVCVSICTCIYVHRISYGTVHICKYMHICLYMYIYIYTDTYIYIYRYINLCMYTYVYVHICVHVHGCMLRAMALMVLKSIGQCLETSSQALIFYSCGKT